MSDKTLMEKVSEIGKKIDAFVANEQPVVEEKVADIGKKLDVAFKEAGEKIESVTEKVAGKVSEEMKKIDDPKKDLPPIPNQENNLSEELEDNADVAD